MPKKTLSRDTPTKKYTPMGTIISSQRWSDEHIEALILLEEELGHSICGARTKNFEGRPCRHLPGYMTPHAGEGRCRWHGGLKPIKTGKFSLLKHYDLNAKVNAFLDSSEMMDIRSAIGTIWATIDTLLEEEGVITADRAQDIVAAMGRIGTLIKQHHDITEGQKIMIEVPQFMEWAEHLYELAIKFILEGTGDVRGFLSEAQGYYSSAVAIVTGDSPPAIGDGSDHEAEELPRS